MILVQLKRSFTRERGIAGLTRERGRNGVAVKAPLGTMMDMPKPVKDPLAMDFYGVIGHSSFRMCVYRPDP